MSVQEAIAAAMALEGCDCGIADEYVACRSVRRALGLEVGNG